MSRLQRTLQRRLAQVIAIRRVTRKPRRETPQPRQKSQQFAFESHQGSIFPFCMRSEEHTSELQSLMRISYAVFCLNKKSKKTRINSCPQETSDYTNCSLHKQ